MDLGEIKKGQDLLHQITDRSVKTINWYNRLKKPQMQNSAEEIKMEINTLLSAASLEQKFENKKEYNEYLDKLLAYAPVYYRNNISVFGNEGRRINLGEHIMLTLVQYAYLDMRDSMEKPGATNIDTTAIDKILKVMEQYSPDMHKEFSGRIQVELDLFRNRK
jgi:hypothetical protein